jgi:PDZ domain-containing protein
MKKLLNQYKKYIITLLFPYIYLMFVLVAPTNYSLLAPGELNTISKNIEIENVIINDDFHTISVYQLSPISAFQKFIFVFSPEIQIYERTIREKNTTDRDDYLQGQLAKFVSLKTSIIQAYTLAKEKDNEIVIDYQFKGLYIYNKPNKTSEFKVGDVIVKIDGKNYHDYTESEFFGLINPNDVEFTILRKVSGEFIEIIINYQFKEGDLSIRYLGNYEIIDTYPKVNLATANFPSGGQSGGLIQTLSIYASLLNINTEGKKIAGTGTILMDGSVGIIGGARQKVFAANHQKADVFFIPQANYNQVKDIKIGYDLVVVSTISEAVNWLYESFN